MGGYCNICGQQHDTTAWPPPKQEKPPVGWICPVCGLGNAPQALKCGHCKPQSVPFEKSPEYIAVVNKVKYGM